MEEKMSGCHDVRRPLDGYEGLKLEAALRALTAVACGDDGLAWFYTYCAAHYARRIRV